MKILILILLIPISASSWGRELGLLKCLGEEEKRFHLKKETGPLYDLNQRLMGEVIQIPNIQLLDEDLKAICEPGSESWNLLALSLQKGKSLFVIPENVIGMQRGMTEGMVEDYTNESKQILLQFISQIQSEAPSSTCLGEEIRGLQKFFFEIKHLEGDVDMKRIFRGRGQKILKHLKNYSVAFDRCRERLKKKAKPVSTEAPKKS